MAPSPKIGVAPPQTGFAALATLMVVLLWPENACAWGAGIHVAQGSFILDNLKMINPQVAATLAECHLDYIYGCISADIFIGKGYRRKPDHCHNWSVGTKVLEGASDKSTKAYAYGYLTHLAADIVAHNYFIPNLLYSTPASSNLGHVYWEFRADRFIKKRNWALATKVVSMHNHGNDTLIKRVMNRSKLRFGAKKMIFKRAVRLNDLMVWRGNVEHAFEGNRRITRKQVSTLNNYSLNLILDLLKKGKDSVCMDYDPVGTDNITESRSRKNSLRSRLKTGAVKDMFQVPDQILQIGYLDHETVRM